MNRNRFQHGFTLIELMVVLALLGILSAIAFYNMHDILDRYAVNGAIRQIFGDVQSAKLGAIKNNKLWAFEVDGSAYCIKNQGTDTGWTTGCNTAGDQIKSTINFTGDYKGVITTYLPTTVIPYRIAFNSDGTSSSSGSGDYQIRMCRGSSGKQITVKEHSGNVKITSITCP